MAQQGISETGGNIKCYFRTSVTPRETQGKENGQLVVGWNGEGEFHHAKKLYGKVSHNLPGKE